MHKRVVGVNHGPSFHAAKQVLGDLRYRLFADMDTSTVKWELLYKDIIPCGVQERTSRTDEPKQQNEILHDWLQRTCHPFPENMIVHFPLTVTVYAFAWFLFSHVHVCYAPQFPPFLPCHQAPPHLAGPLLEVQY